jgi:hypothetical protein
MSAPKRLVAAPQVVAMIEKRDAQIAELLAALREITRDGMGYGKSAGDVARAAIAKAVQS